MAERNLVIVSIALVFVAIFGALYSKRGSTPTALALDLRNTVPQLIDSVPLTPALEKIRKDAETILTGSAPRTNPDYTELRATGKRYVLLTIPGTESTLDVIVDAILGTVTNAGSGYSIETNTGVIYINYDSLSYYRIDTPAAVLVSGSQLDASQETYNSGGDIPLVSPVETHAEHTITVSVYDTNSVVANPGTPDYKLRKVRESSFVLP